MRKAKILFQVASVVTILGGIAHFIGQFAGMDDPREPIVVAMQNYRIGSGAHTFSMWDVTQAFGVGLGAELIWIGLLGVFLAGYLAEKPAMLRTAALLNSAGCAAFILSALHYGIFPPIIIMSAPLICFVLAVIFARQQNRAGMAK